MIRLGVMGISKDTLESLSYLTAILSGTAAAILFLSGRYRNWNEQVQKEFFGKWTNEGCIDCEETHYVDLELEAHGKELTGILSVTGLNNSAEWNNLSVVARLTPGRQLSPTG
jgi:hypothetical protein